MWHVYKDNSYESQIVTTAAFSSDLLLFAFKMILHLKKEKETESSCSLPVGRPGLSKYHTQIRMQSISTECALK